MKRIALLLCLTLVAAAANAQLTGIRARAGYGWSGSFSGVGGSGRLNGPVLGVDLPLTHLPLVEVNFTTNVLFGGAISHGSDLDGNVYTFMLTGRASLPGSKIGVFGGMGWATAQSRNGQFAAVNGMVSQIGVSMPLGANLPLLSPSLELAGNFSSKAALSGFSATIAVRF